MAVVERGRFYRLHDDGHKDIGNSICYRDNDTGDWTDSSYAHSNDPEIHPGNKPEFAGGLCEEHTFCRKYSRNKKNNQPLMGLSWRGEDGTANKERWLNLRTIGADEAVEPITGDHSVKWVDAWTDADYDVHYFSYGGCEFRMTLKSSSAPTTFEWTLKMPEYCSFMVDPGDPLNVAMFEGEERIMTMAGFAVIVNGADYPIPDSVWSIVEDNPLDRLVLTLDPVAVSAAFDAGATSIEVRA